jgi:DnaJ-class molecular chaperone
MSSLGRKTLYDVLGISPYATRQEIKSQFYKLSMLYHPDTAVDVNSTWRHDKFVQISNAYSILSNDLKRRAYDQEQQLKPIHKERNWRYYPGTRHSTTEQSSWPNDPRHYVPNETVRRWAKWASDSSSEQMARKFERVFSEEEQRRESLVVKNRWLALLISVTFYLILSNKTA